MVKPPSLRLKQEEALEDPIAFSIQVLTLTPGEKVSPLSLYVE